MGMSLGIGNIDSDPAIGQLSGAFEAFEGKTAIQSVAGTTLEDCTDISFTVLGNATYHLDFGIYIRGDSASDLDLQLTGPAETTFNRVYTDFQGVNNNFLFNTKQLYNLAGVSSPQFIKGWANYKPTANGTLKLQYAKNVNNSFVIIEVGTFMRATLIV